LKTLAARLREPRRFIQVVAGPRQVGKTTVALQLRDSLNGLTAFHSADDTPGYGSAWIDQIWESLRIRMNLDKKNEAILFIDEIQKVSDWSRTVKGNWDRDTREKTNIKLVLLGSSRLLLVDGLSESLMGRFELSYAGHWGFDEMKKAFGFTPGQYQWFGGYPGAAAFIDDEPRFKEYVRNAIIEPTMNRDVLMTAKVDKPALLRQLFEVGAAYSANIMSYSKMLGQLQDAGNTTTLARYLQLLDQAGLLSGLNKYDGKTIRMKGTIPKFQIHNTALLSALKPALFEDAVADLAGWGAVYESSVGARLVDQVRAHPNAGLYYWRENNREVDYVVRYGNDVIGIEAKSGPAGISAENRAAFLKRFPGAALILVGESGLPYETFMRTDLADLASCAR
jgi:predicted AAA+ superfamily ATPase